MQGFALFVRVRGGAAAAVAVAMILTSCVAVPVEVGPNPLIVDSGTVLLPLVGLMAGAFLAVSLPNPMFDLEEVCLQGQLRLLRCLWLVVLTVAFMFVGIVGFWWLRELPWHLGAIHCRNTLFGVGIGVMSASVMPRQMAWVPPSLVTAACWLLGVSDQMGTARTGFLPCYPSYSWPASLAAITLWLAAVVMYVMRDTWHPKS